MPLTNFGAVLSFAEQMEAADAAFYKTAAAAHTGDLHRRLTQLAEQADRHAALIQRTRRENVTEMILEPIAGLLSSEFHETPGDTPEQMDAAAVVAAVRRLERRAVRYYTESAARLGALPEVGRALKQLAQKHRRRLEGLPQTE